MVSDEMQQMGGGIALDSATSNLALSDIISSAMGHENGSSKKDKNDLNVSDLFSSAVCSF